MLIDPLTCPPWLRTAFRATSGISTAIVILVYGTLFSFRLAEWNMGWLAILCFATTLLLTSLIILHTIERA